MYMREQVLLSMIREVGTTGGLPWAFMGCWDDKSGFPIMILSMILDRDFIKKSNLVDCEHRKPGSHHTPKSLRMNVLRTQSRII